MAGNRSSLLYAVLMAAIISQAMSSAVQTRHEATVSPQILMSMIEQQAETIQQQAENIQKQADVIEQLQNRLTVVETSANARVFFTAFTTSSPVSTGDSSPIVFDRVITNQGGAYSSASGVFTAPVDGDYVFYAKIMYPSAGGDGHINWIISKSNTILCQNEVNGSATFTSSSCHAVTHLQKGDHVFVRRASGKKQINGGHWCSFSGFLLNKV